MLKDEAKLKIQELVEKYEKVKASHAVSKYTEEETKKDFIQPLFQALGWNTTDKNEVTAEQVMSAGRIDYGFYLNGRLKFNVEAKSLKTDLNRLFGSFLLELKEFLFLEFKHSGDYIVWEHFNFSVQVTDIAIIKSASGLDFIFSIRELIL